MISKLHAHPSTPDEKHLVLLLMMMPEKFPLELHHLHFLPV